MLLLKRKKEFLPTFDKDDSTFEFVLRPAVVLEGKDIDVDVIGVEISFSSKTESLLNSCSSFFEMLNISFAFNLKLDVRYLKDKN